MMRRLPNVASRSRSGFTLLELLVVTSIVVVLLTITLTGFRINSESDRIRKGARQLQSYLKGAQDRAIYSQKPVGIRMFVDRDTGGVTPTGRTVTTVAYVGTRSNWSSARDSGRVDLERIDLNGNGTWYLDAATDPGEADVLIVRGFNDPGWFNLFDRGFLEGNLRIRIPAGPTGEWYPFVFLDTEDINGNTTLETYEDTIVVNGVLDTEDANGNGVLDAGEDTLIVNGMLDTEDANGNGRLDTEDLDGDGMITDPITAPNSEQLLRLLVPYHDPGTVPPTDPTDPAAHKNLTYEIELAWQVLPEEPCILPEGVVIDLDGSKVPTAWRPASTGTGLYEPYMDIVFSPQGTVIGDAAGAGLLHLYVCDSEDSQYLKERFVDDVGLAAFDAGVPTIPFVPLDEVPGGSWLPDGDNHLVKERRVVSIFGQTGHVSVHQVNAYRGESGGAVDSNSDYLSDDPYQFAEIGEDVN